ncbi:MAG: archease [Nitrospiria bacterium]
MRPSDEGFEYLDEITTGDVAMVARGGSLDTLFQTAAKGLSETMVETKGVRPNMAKEIILSADGIDRLLHRWLSELVYLKDAECLLFSLFEVKVQLGSHHRLRGVAMGERIDRNRHHLRCDVKAVTYHRFQVERVDHIWKATMVFDI